MGVKAQHFVASEDLRVAKIRGEKVFASDFRAVDLTAALGWPSECAHALLIRATCINRKFAGLDLARMSDDLVPDVVITADMLSARGFANIAGRKFLLCPPGLVPEFLSQPLAILLFNDFLCFRRAAQELREDRGIVVYGPLLEVPASKSLVEILADWRQLQPPMGLPNLKHYVFSSVPEQASSQWEGGALKRQSGSFARTVGAVTTPDLVADALYAELNSLGPGNFTVETTTFTQQVDPAFMEPEAGLAFFDGNSIHLLTGTQSPFSDLTDLQSVFGIVEGKPAAGNVARIDIIAVDPGGGFGGRDKAPLSSQLAIAAAFANRPVRLAYDRFEQFQAGIKRHGSAVHSVVSASPDGLLDRALVHFVFEGGAETNLGAAVMGLGALHATGFYRFNVASTNGAFTARPLPIVGSMRGFGIPQVIFNVETAIDRLASLNLRLDPLEFRRRNVLVSNANPLKADRDLAGTPLTFNLANEVICHRASLHTLWLSRNAVKDTFAERGIYRGVGFAGCMEAYGTSGDSTFVAVKLESDGSITVMSEAADMGQGARRSLARTAEGIFGVVVRAALGQLQPFVSFQAQFLATLTKSQSQTIPNGHASSSASKTAFFHLHVLKEVARAFLVLKLFPAVRELSGTDDDDETVSKRFRNGVFDFADGTTISLLQVAQHLEATGGERFAIAHGAFSYGWSSTKFTDAGCEHSAYIDALAFAPDEYSKFRMVTRGDIVVPEFGASKTPPPRSGYASGGHLIAVEIDPRARRIRVTDAVAFLDAGDPVIENVLLGQIEGGFQMGLAHALFEELPPESGQDRFVNFDRYILPRASDVASIRLSSVLLPLPPEGALNGDQANIRHKGIGEITMTTVAPAIANAIAHALGAKDAKVWPSKLPIRFDDLFLPEVSGA